MNRLFENEVRASASDAIRQPSERLDVAAPEDGRTSRWLLVILFAMVLLLGCAPLGEQDEERGEEISLYNEHEGLTLPEDMQRHLGVELTTVTDTNAIPESAIIRGAQEDFTYVKDGKHFVRTRLEEVVAGVEIVSQGVKDLWMIELLAIRGGEACCQ